MNLKQLSETLGLSPTTVSRALNGYPEVAEITRKRVEKAARAHNYRPNSRAAGLATGRAMAIGHVIPVSDTQELVNPVFGDFLAGAGETYAGAGFEMVLSILDRDNEESVYRNLKSRGAVDGLVMHSPRMRDGRIGFLTKLGLPFVVHGRASGIALPYSWLDVDNRRAFARGTRHLTGLGHRRIGLINGREHLDFAYRRRLGYFAGLAEAGIEADPLLMASEEMTEGYGYQSARAMLDGEDPPTAFLVASTICALGARRAVEERGLRLGRDISLVAHDDALSYLRNDGPDPVFTALRSSVREAGRQVARMLLSRIAEPGRAPDQILLEADLIPGQSSGPAPTGA